MILYQNLELYLSEKNIKKRIWIIDENLNKLWQNRISKLLNKDLFFIMESTEKNKNIDTYHQILNFMFENNVDRSYTIFALGGGIIGDTTAFVASTYMRGISLVHVPTTLLSMVDSSIGGKAGVNNIYGKNMVGSIYQANDIIIDLKWLETLDEKQKINGMAEVIKMALIKGGKLYNLVNNSDPNSWNNLEEIIKLSADYKLDIIKNDHKDITGERELLNLGHTWGHALEFSQDLLHGYAVADGIIEEMKYSNYYYNFPSFNTMQIILKLLKKWKLVNDSKSLALNDISKNYGTRLLNFYLTKDKKSDRMVTIEKIGSAKIIKWDLDKWKFLNSKNFMIINNKISFPKLVELKVPSSKSITNRALICGVISSLKSNKPINITDILKSEDTQLMIQALKQSNVNIEEKNNDVIIKPSEIIPNGKYYLGNSGTSVRFLLPVLAFLTSKKIIIDGSEEMRKRPIGPLVKSLNDFGCNIKSFCFANENIVNDEIYLPLEIEPVQLNFSENNIIEIDGSLSSQYVTGLMIGFSFLKLKNENLNFTINILGNDTSKGFIDLSKKVLNDFGINLLQNNLFAKQMDLTNNKITINNIIEVSNHYQIEGDATTASYLYAWSIINKFNLRLTNLNKTSAQPDMNVLLKVLKYFGHFDGDTFIPDNIININNLEILDLDSSDTFLTWGCLFALYNIPIEITNIENQDWKECARITNFISNLKLLGVEAIKTSTGFKIIKGINNFGCKIKSEKIIETYNDHRMAMSFSLLSLNNKNILINNPHCVSKTFPKYWDELKKLGIEILPVNKINYKKVILIGMPGSGKTTLAKEVGKKFNIKYVDTDQRIANEHTSINEIIKTKGWKQFRNLEATELLNILDDDSVMKIVSTGGGIIENHISRNLMENNLVIWIKRPKNKICLKSRELPDSYDNLEIKRSNIYESISNYIYYNDGSPEDFTRWLNLILFQNPIPSKSTFLCKSELSYEENISNYIEVRGDLFEENYGIKDIQKMMISYNKPCIYTLRTQDEGGKFNKDTDEYIKLNNLAIKLGASLIDLEVNKNVRLKNSIKTIGSIHSDNISYILDNFKKFNNDIIKIVTSDDNCQTLKNNKNLIESKVDKIIIDNNSTNYRISNNYLTPISSSISRQTASNQLNFKNYLEKSNKKFLFLIGNNIGESPSSYIHNEVIDDENTRYYPFETNNFDSILDLTNKSYFKGASITIPYKESFNNNLKAINTIKKRSNSLDFYNTDTLAIKYFLEDLPIFILGTGGASIGAIEACLDKNVIVVGRNEEKLEKLKESYKNVKIQLLDNFESLNYPHIIINTIPPNFSIINFVNKHTYLIDMTYGIHILTMNNFVNKYVSGYDILYVQAAYQYIEWFKAENVDEIMIKYKKAMNNFIESKYSLII